MFGRIKAMTMDPEGNIYVATENHRIRVIDKNGRAWNLAGTGVQGYKDGPANSAMFNQGGNGYPYLGIAIDSKGSLYVSDGINGKIRRIFKKASGEWWVDSYAGNGDTTLSPGEASRLENLKLNTPTSVAVDSFDNVWTQSGNCIYKITGAGVVSCFENTAGNAVMMQADKIGNVYILTRTPNDAFFKVTQGGTVTRIAGMLKTEEEDLTDKGLPLPIDGPALESTFHELTSFTVSPDGTTLYGGNGDEFVVRRVKNNTTMTLFEDGWRIEPTKRNNGWFLGGPMYVDSNGIIYLVGNNPPRQPGLRKITPIP
ncbi:MAG: hypothetical protein JXR49_16150 [Acidobacteria bacterium]|nr:hypothetical protein [Acidobacteriota bacterium]